MYLKFMLVDSPWLDSSFVCVVWRLQLERPCRSIVACTLVAGQKEDPGVATGDGLAHGRFAIRGGSFTMRNCQDGWEIPPDAGKPVCPEQGNESLMDDPTMEP